MNQNDQTAEQVSGYNGFLLSPDQIKNLTASVSEFRRAGYKVRVIHYRWIASGIKYMTTQKPVLMPMYDVKNRKLQQYVLARGGKTKVEVTDPIKNINVDAEAVCSLEDSFDRRYGIVLALGRIKSKLIHTESDQNNQVVV